MEPARRISRIVGPVLMVLAPSEGFNLGVFANVSPSLVYLNGVILLAAGVAILQAHWRWSPDWTSLVTLTGWALTAGGIYRLVAPAAPQLTPSGPVYAFLSVLFVAGAVLSWQGYRPIRGG